MVKGTAAPGFLTAWTSKYFNSFYRGQDYRFLILQNIGGTAQKGTQRMILKTVTFSLCLSGPQTAPRRNQTEPSFSFELHIPPLSMATLSPLTLGRQAADPDLDGLIYRFVSFNSHAFS